MWHVVNQEKIKELNEAVNQQWELVRHLQGLHRWKKDKARYRDILLLRDNLEQISALLAEAIIWE